MTTTAIRNATVVTVDGDDTVLEGATVVIDGPTIVDLVPSGSTPSRPIDVEIDAGGGLLHPGLVNTHSHLAMTLFRGYADDLDLQAFLDRLLPAEGRVLSADHVRIGSRLAHAELLRAGCTSALDMYWWPDVSLDVARESGLRLQAGPIFIGFDGPDHTPFADRLERTRASAPHDWLFAHGTYTMDPSQLREVGDLAAELGTRFHIHASENRSEVDDVRSRFGRTPIELLDDAGVLRPGTVLAHAVVLDDDEITRLAETGTAIAHCPCSNLKLASGVCRVPDLHRAGVTVGLGTDGPSSSNDLDMYVAMRTAALIQKGALLDPTLLPAATVLRMATIEGARALGIDSLVGSIEIGKRADLVLLDAESPSLTPIFDPHSAIVYSASRADVTDVWVDGRRVVADRRCTTIDVPSAIRDARAEASII